MPAATLEITEAALRVAGVLDFESVPTLAASGDEWIRQGSGAFRIDLAGVDYSSSAGLALLLAWLRSAATAGRPATIDGMPAELAALARVGGIDDLLPVADDRAGEGAKGAAGDVHPARG